MMGMDLVWLQYASFHDYTMLVLGVERWPPGVFLKFTYGDQLGPITFLLVDAVEPMGCTDVSVEMISPASNGIYQAQWRMCSPMGQYFGGKCFERVIIL